MKRRIARIVFGWILICSGLMLSAQNIDRTEIKKLKPPKDFENVHVEKLYSDKHVSSSVIWIREKVPLHFHAEHSEHVYVLKGKARMRLGDYEFDVKKGDFIFIPEGTQHSVHVKGGILQVISVQAPEFKGKDRIQLKK